MIFKFALKKKNSICRNVSNPVGHLQNYVYDEIIYKYLIQNSYFMWDTYKNPTIATFYMYTPCSMQMSYELRFDRRFHRR